MKVLVTGGSSLIGSGVARQLAARGDDVAVFQRRTSGLPLEEEPLLQNNSVFHRMAPWSRDGMVDRLRRYGRERLRATRP